MTVREQMSEIRQGRNLKLALTLLIAFVAFLSISKYLTIYHEQSIRLRYASSHQSDAHVELHDAPGLTRDAPGLRRDVTYPQTPKTFFLTTSTTSFYKNLKCETPKSPAVEESSAFNATAHAFVVNKFRNHTMRVEFAHVLMGVIQMWAGLARRLGVTWFLTHGTLMGSYHHHGLVPYDTDADILVPKRERERLIPHLKNLSSIYPQYFADLHLDFVSKLATRKSYTINPDREEFRDRQAFLDLFWYDENATHVILPVGEYYIRKKFIFPLTLRPLHGELFPAPRDPRGALEDSYTGSYWRNDLSLCHMNRQPPLPCLSLHHVFPVVRMSRCVVPKLHANQPPVNMKASKDVMDRPLDVSNQAVHVCREELILRNRVISVFFRVVQDVPIC